MNQSTPPSSATERRAAPRTQLIRPVKLRQEAGGWRYLPGQTADLSTLGARLDVDSPTPLRPGHRIELAIADAPQAAILSAEGLIPATIVRSTWHADRQEIAVRFATPLSDTPLPQAG